MSERSDPTADAPESDAPQTPTDLPRASWWARSNARWGNSAATTSPTGPPSSLNALDDPPPEPESSL
jgi:hypothetical protein